MFELWHIYGKLKVSPECFLETVVSCIVVNELNALRQKTHRFAILNGVPCQNAIDLIAIACPAAQTRRQQKVDEGDNLYYA